MVQRRFNVVEKVGQYESEGRTSNEIEIPFEERDISDDGIRPRILSDILTNSDRIASTTRL